MEISNLRERDWSADEWRSSLVAVSAPDRVSSVGLHGVMTPWWGLSRDGDIKLPRGETWRNLHANDEV